jgi:DNA repair protein RecN (Recombination protein N)
VLEEMRIRNLGVIEEAVLDFAAGLTVVTGETGAGKTMVVQGLGLLLGARADVGRLRPGASQALVEGVWRVPAPVAVRVRDAGGLLDEDVLLVTRTVSAEGRSRAHLGGVAAPVALLGEVTGALVAVHGQSDQQRLLRPGEQRALLDRFAGPAALEPLRGYREAYARLRAVEHRLADLCASAQHRAQQADLLRFGLREVEAAAPEPGEREALALETERLAHAEALVEAARTAHALLAEEDGGDATALVSSARRALEQQAAHDPQLAGLASRVAEAGYLLADVASDLAGYADSVDADPARLAAAQERRAVLAALSRKYGDDVLGWAEHAAVRLAELDGADAHVASLETERAELRAELARLGSAGSAARGAAAERLAAAAAAELADLAMPHASVVLRVSQAEAPDGLDVGGRRLGFGPDGLDDVEILLQPHPGAPPRPLAHGASGGELSRVMLALEVVLAGADPTPTFVFDEVDAGVGGRAAVEVGRRLARLAETAQVLVVTHLPQVAAYADRHLLVAKESDGRVTRSGVTALDDAGRVRELSRMLAGLEESALARGHAEELLAAAAARKRR